MMFWLILGLLLGFWLGYLYAKPGEDSVISTRQFDPPECTDCQRPMEFKKEFLRGKSTSGAVTEIFTCPGCLSSHHRTRHPQPYGGSGIS